jgi:hypothetical protein
MQWEEGVLASGAPLTFLALEAGQNMDRCGQGCVLALYTRGEEQLGSGRKNGPLRR